MTIYIMLEMFSLRIKGQIRLQISIMHKTNAYVCDDL